MNIKIQEKYQLYIGGEWKDSSDGTTIKTYNPANGQLLSEIADATKKM